ncbi:hypothetical protein X801_04971, partial [Opisthorchis viverrini]
SKAQTVAAGAVRQANAAADAAREVANQAAVQLSAPTPKTTQQAPARQPPSLLITEASSIEKVEKEQPPQRDIGIPRSFDEPFAPSTDGRPAPVGQEEPGDASDTTTKCILDAGHGTIGSAVPQERQWLHEQTMDVTSDDDYDDDMFDRMQTLSDGYDSSTGIGGNFDAPKDRQFTDRKASITTQDSLADTNLDVDGQRALLARDRMLMAAATGVHSPVHKGPGEPGYFDGLISEMGTAKKPAETSVRHMVIRLETEPSIAQSARITCKMDSINGGESMDLNGAKSAAMIVEKSDKRKTLAIVPGSLQVGSNEIKCLGPTDTVKYLGLRFNWKGRLKMNAGMVFQEMLVNISKAAPKPYQKLVILKEFATPRLQYELVLGSAHRNTLKALDVAAHHAVRAWLRLPKDTPLGFFYAKVKDGGLGPMSFATTIPLLQRQKFQRIASSPDAIVRGLLKAKNVVSDQRLAYIPVRAKETLVSSADEASQAWRADLKSSVDGRELVIDSVDRASRTFCKPDLVVRHEEHAYVLDVTVARGQRLAESWTLKTTKYGSREVETYVQSKLFGQSLGDVRHLPVVFTDRGLLCERSGKGLRSLGLTTKELSVLCLLVIRGSLACYDVYMRGT